MILLNRRACFIIEWLSDFKIRQKRWFSCLQIKATTCHTDLLRKVFYLFCFISLLTFPAYAQTPIPGNAGNIVNGAGGALLNGPYSIYVSGNYAYVGSINSSVRTVTCCSSFLVHFLDCLWT